MRTLLVALNSKFIHSSLALWYLKSACEKECIDVNIAEYTINDQFDRVLQSIYSSKPDILAFSCYIWNIDFIRSLVNELRKLLPEVKIILGGPEAGFSSKELIESQIADFVINGEGEFVFPELLKVLGVGSSRIDIQGVCTRENMGWEQPFITINNLDDLQSPYSNEYIATLNNRILYFEASRGCPYSCSYCISSTFHGVRYFSMEYIKMQLQRFIELEIPLVKFVDRTFNANKTRAYEIINFIIENAKSSVFHFEIAGDILDDTLIELLKTAPSGLIQFEMGVQSSNEKTLEQVERVTNTKKLKENILKLRSFNNIHLHLDLIAGLPYEDIGSFEDSFDFVMGMMPNELQLGFLKLLKGSKIRKEEKKFEYAYRERPPYEVLRNKFINFDELILLKDIEEALDKFYNTGRFMNTFRYLFDVFGKKYYKLFFELPVYLKNQNRLYSKSTLSGLYKDLFKFIKDLGGINEEFIRDLLKYDFLISENTNNLPRFLQKDLNKSFHEHCFEFLKDEENIKKYLPQFQGVPAKKIIKSVHLEGLKLNIEELQSEKNEFIYLFDYSSKDKVSSHYKAIRLK